MTKKHVIPCKTIVNKCLCGVYTVIAHDINFDRDNTKHTIIIIRPTTLLHTYIIITVI